MNGPPQIDLRTQLRDVTGIGPRQAAALAGLGLTNVGKLVAHLPMRHEKLEAEGRISDLAAARIGSVRGEVTDTRVIQWGRRPRFEAVLMDESGRLDLVWFNGVFLKDKIHPGARLRVQGQARRIRGGLQMANPQYELIGDGEEPEERTARLRPVYPASEQINSKQIERAVGLVLDAVLPQIEDHLSEAYRAKRAMPSLADAYRLMHRPEDEDDVKAGRRRLAYDELLLLQLGVHLKRAHLRRRCVAPALRNTEAIDRHIRDRLPFTLTPGQEKVVDDIRNDLSSAVPTNRLIQGEVGSGKTLVAVYAMLMAAASECQAALVAPTEILAEQHYASISEMLAGSRVRLQLLTGATPRGEREALVADLAAGHIDVLIGTHSLLTESVKFASLAVAVIDEQHRFGVHQRASLRTRGNEPGSVAHVLVMTATPIPRSLSMTLFGDLDVSVIDGMPPGRKPVRTRVVSPMERHDVYAEVRTRLDEKEQAFIVTPAIDTDDSQIAGVRSLMDRLERGPLAGKHIAMLHGRLSRATREHVMARFRSGLIDAIVATTVIEVGVDVPGATVMVVENADRFGLAQLHQLRGRVGRADKPGICILIGEATTPGAAERLKALESSTDGFALAEKDLEIRGPGEFFGTRQAGEAPFKVADLARDVELLSMARRDAAAWIDESALLDREEDALVRRRLLRAHGDSLGLGDVG